MIRQLLSFSLCLTISLISLGIFFSCSSSTRSSQWQADQWIAEDESDATQISFSNDTLELVVPAGLTYWYNQRLTGNYEISYFLSMPMNRGKIDRLSDLNCFWAANDPKHPDNFFMLAEWRNGEFKNYNSLNLFYVGYGGNENTTTRFRRYYAKFFGVDDIRVKPLIKEYTDPDHLLEAGKWYHIVIRVNNNATSYNVNGEALFSYQLSPGEGDGYFGLRLLQNHVLMTGFQVKQI